MTKKSTQRKCGAFHPPPLRSAKTCQIRHGSASPASHSLVSPLQSSLEALPLRLAPRRTGVSLHLEHSGLLLFIDREVGENLFLVVRLLEQLVDSLGIHVLQNNVVAKDLSNVFQGYSLCLCCWLISW